MNKNYTFFLALALASSFFLGLAAKQGQSSTSEELEIKFFFPNMNVKQTVTCKIKSGKAISGQKIIKAFNTLKKKLDLESNDQYFLGLNGGKVLSANEYTVGDFARNVIVMEDKAPVKLKNLPEKIQEDINLLNKKLTKIKAMVNEKFTDYYAMFKNPDLAVHGEKTVRALGQMYGRIDVNIDSCLSAIKALKD